MSMRFITVKTNIKSNQTGFSLLEVLISLVLISFGLLSLTGLQTRSVNLSTEAYTDTQSTLYLQEIVEMLRANKGAAADGEYNIALSPFSAVSNGTTIAEKGRYNWFSKLNSTLTGAKASINCASTFNCSLELQHEFLGQTKAQSLAVIL